MKTLTCATAAIVGTLALSTLAACGSDSDNSSAGSGAPVKFMLIGTLESAALSTSQTETAAKAAVKKINAEGGISGRDVEVSFCNDKFDPNEATACAQRAVEEKVAAVVGGASAMSDSFLPVLEAAKIPLIGGSASSGAPELVSPISYPVNSGAAVMTYGAGYSAAQQGDETAILTTDNDGSVQGTKYAQEGLKIQGASAAEEFTMKLGAPDAAPTVAAALETNPTTVILTAPPVDAVKMVNALRQAGYEGKIVAPSSFFPPASIEALGDFAEGIVGASRLLPVTSTEVPEVKTFVDAMTAFDPEASLDDLSMNTWTAYMLLDKVLEGKNVNGPADVISAMDAVSSGDPIELGTAPAYRGIQKDPDVPEFPRVATFATVFSEITDGKLVQTGDFVNPAEKAS